MNCKKCGTPLAPTASFCPNCGEIVNNIGAVNNQNVASGNMGDFNNLMNGNPNEVNQMPNNNQNSMYDNQGTVNQGINPNMMNNQNMTSNQDISNNMNNQNIGVNPSTINQPFNSPNNGNNLNTNNNKNNNTFIIIVGVLVALAVILIVAIGIKAVNKNNSNSNNNNNSSDTAKDNTTNTDNKTNQDNNNNNNNNNNGTTNDNKITTYQAYGYTYTIPSNLVATIDDDNNLTLVNKEQTLAINFGFTDLSYDYAYNNIDVFAQGLAALGFSTSNFSEATISNVNFIVFNISANGENGMGYLAKLTDSYSYIGVLGATKENYYNTAISYVATMINGAKATSTFAPGDNKVSNSFENSNFFKNNGISSVAGNPKDLK